MQGCRRAPYLTWVRVAAPITYGCSPHHRRLQVRAFPDLVFDVLEQARDRVKLRGRVKLRHRVKLRGKAWVWVRSLASPAAFAALSSPNPYPSPSPNPTPYPNPNP